jgi:hypothetical protein
VKKNKEKERCKLSSEIEEIFTVNSFGNVTMTSISSGTNRSKPRANKSCARNCGHGQENFLFNFPS